MDMLALTAFLLGTVTGWAVTCGIWAAVESYRARRGSAFWVNGRQYKLKEEE